jgi:hypothetical protein
MAHAVSRDEQDGAFLPRQTDLVPPGVFFNSMLRHAFLGRAFPLIPLFPTVSIMLGKPDPLRHCNVGSIGLPLCLALFIISGCRYQQELLFSRVLLVRSQRAFLEPAGNRECVP